MKSAVTGIVSLYAHGMDPVRSAPIFPKTSSPQFHEGFHVSQAVEIAAGDFFIFADDHKSSNKT